MSETSKGVFLFAENNESIDYIKHAVAAGQLAKKNLDVPVALATTEESIELSECSLEYIEKQF